MSNATVTVRCCQRCGQDHELVFKPLSNPADLFTHWSLCPLLQEPVLLAVTHSATNAAETPTGDRGSKCIDPSGRKPDSSVAEMAASFTPGGRLPPCRPPPTAETPERTAASTLLGTFDED